MDWGSAIGGIANAAGSIGGGILGAYTNYHYSKKMYDYQMSNAHQLEVEDLRKAGLNPILSAQGNTNSTGFNAGADFSGLGDAFSKAFQMAVAKQQVENMQATAKNIDADTELKLRQAGSEISKANMYRTQASINASNAYEAERLNRYFDSHPSTYDVMKSNQALPGIGGIGAIADYAYQALGNSASKVLENVHNIQRDYNSKFQK